eukprot:TRINITY_DN178_c1_g1_i1.p1 TRINITY_DN178_c1_g1~~TRINITY_DN178_c1_g1_i1.p1  ORF type:complete len:758 (-),score=139.49 TRINITY_DN178_c1_g1_i1:352-2625(-)
MSGRHVTINTDRNGRPAAGPAMKTLARASEGMAIRSVPVLGDKPGAGGSNNVMQELSLSLGNAVDAAKRHGACYLHSEGIAQLKGILDMELVSVKSILDVIYKSVQTDMPPPDSSIRRAVSHIDIAGMTREKTPALGDFIDNDNPTLDQVLTPRSTARPPSREAPEIGRHSGSTASTLGRGSVSMSGSRNQRRRQSWSVHGTDKVPQLDFRKGMELDNMQSPMEKAVLLLNQLRSQQSDSMNKPAFDYIQRVLVSNNSNALAPQIQVGSRDVDSVEYTFLKFTGVLKPESNVRELHKSGDLTDDIGGLWLQKKREANAPRVLPQVDNVREGKVVQELDRIDTLDFDVFKITEWTEGQPLLCVMYELFDFYDLFKTLHLNSAIFYNFITEIERRYLPDNPYHCSTHAADVVQTTHHFIQGGVGEHFSDIDIFVSLLAAAIHDVDHPGRNNVFQLKTSSPLAILYNDKSILENHHLATAFKIMNDKASHDILSCLDSKTRTTVREGIIAAVLATDLSQHFGLVSQFKGRIEALKAVMDDPDATLEASDRQAIQLMVMKASDISNPVKNPSLYLKWTERVMEEFYRQGDDEAAFGMDISPFCDRKNPTVSKCQIGFINFIVHPLYSAFSEVFPFVAQHVKQLESNKNMWSQLDTNRGHYQVEGTSKPSTRPATRQKGEIGGIGSPRKAKVERLQNTSSSSLRRATRGSSAGGSGSEDTPPTIDHFPPRGSGDNGLGSPRGPGPVSASALSPRSTPKPAIE